MNKKFEIWFKSPLLEKILSEIEQLTPEEQLTVMGYLLEQIKKNISKPQAKPKWKDLKGMACNLFCRVRPTFYTFSRTKLF